MKVGMSFRRGGQRVGFGLALPLFLYWTCAMFWGRRLTANGTEEQRLV